VNTCESRGFVDNITFIVLHQRRSSFRARRFITGAASMSRTFRLDGAPRARLLGLSLAAALLAATASAQTSTGGLRGFIKDDTGGALAGVTVEASSPARIGGAAVEVTDAQGLYTFQNLPIGVYVVSYSL
jgi:hypothetical protein